MKTFIFLTLIILTIGAFSLNADTKLNTSIEVPEAPVQTFTGYKKDISSAD